MTAPKFSERHPITGLYTPLQPKLEYFSEQKRMMWEQTLKDEREKVGQMPITFTGGLPSPPKKPETTVFWDFHNVADYNLDLFVKTVQFLNLNGVESRILSFVGRGTASHANVLIICSNPIIKALIKQVDLVFDKKNPVRGKGHIIREWLLTNPNKVTVFVDDSADNFTNVRKALGQEALGQEALGQEALGRCKFVHFVGADDAKQEVTPKDAQRVEQWNNLHDIVCENVLRSKDE